MGTVQDVCKISQIIKEGRQPLVLESLGIRILCIYLKHMEQTPSI